LLLLGVRYPQTYPNIPPNVNKSVRTA
jgi:hypothetical protein